MHESYAKYPAMRRIGTCLLIDEAPVILLGRTFRELAATIMCFLGLAYIDEPWWGLVAAALAGGVIPLYRIKYVRGFAVHVAWSVGLVFQEMKLFTPRRGTRVMGP